MEREKLNKAAEEDYYGSDYLAKGFRRAFEKGAEWLMQQPLADRLTDEEKEKIIGRYNDELEAAQYYTHKMKESNNPTARQSFANIREDYISRIKLLENIFGKDLFNDNPKLLK